MILFYQRHCTIAPYRSRFASPPPNPSGIGGALRRILVDSKNSQVYWKAIFSDRTSPIQNAKVTVKLPKSLAGTINSYTYYPKSIPVSSQKLDDQTVEFITQKTIPPQQKLEVKVAFPNGVLDIQKPKSQQSKSLQKDFEFLKKYFKVFKEDLSSLQKDNNNILVYLAVFFVYLITFFAYFIDIFIKIFIMIGQRTYACFSSNQTRCIIKFLLF